MRKLETVDVNSYIPESLGPSPVHSTVRCRNKEVKIGVCKGWCLNVYCVQEFVEKDDER